MEDTPEKIITDIYALDPSLKEHDAQIRVLVSTLFVSRPVVEINPAFVHNLRTTLLRPRTSTASSHTWNWWAIHFAPIGVIAVLTITLVPRLLFTPPQDTPEQPLPGSTETVPETPITPQSKLRSTQVVPEPSLMQVSSDAVISSVSFSIPPQKPGNIVHVDFVDQQQPGFVVIHTNDEGIPGAVLGVSSMLPLGHSEGITVPLIRETEVGETLFATLAQDNGNGIFEESADSPIFDASGITPLSTLFSVE